MRRLIFLLLLLIAVPCFGQQQEARMNLSVVGGGVATPAGTPCTGANPSDCTFRETFDGSTSCYDGDSNNNCDNTWTYGVAAPNMHYTTSPLQGSHSWLLDVSNSHNARLDFAAKSTFYAAGMIKFTTRPTDENWLFAFLDSGYAYLCGMVYYPSTHKIEIYSSGGGTLLSTTISADTIYYWKVKWVAGGANPDCTGWLSTNGTTWTDTAQATTGANVNNTISWRAATATGAVYILDDIRLYTGDITW